MSYVKLSLIALEMLGDFIARGQIAIIEDLPSLTIDPMKHDHQCVATEYVGVLFYVWPRGDFIQL